jgi:anti-anti-sigma factor
MDIERRGDRGVIRLVVRGELDLAQVTRLRRAIEDSGRPGRTVIVDLSRLDFIDTAGLTLLLRMRQDARRGLWRMSISPHRSPAVERAIALCGMTDLPRS